MSQAIANRYEVLSDLGEGGTGRVFAVRDTLRQREAFLMLLRDRGPSRLADLRSAVALMSGGSLLEVDEIGILEDGTPYLTMVSAGGQAALEVHDPALEDEAALLRREWQDKSRKLEMLQELSLAVSRTLVMDEVLERVIKLTLEITKAERGLVLLWEHDHLQPRAAFAHTGLALEPEKAVFSQSICMRVLETGLPICVTDLEDDGAFLRRQSIVKQNLRAVMCVPLIAKQVMLGLLYVDSRLMTHSFNAQDLALFQSVANHASLAIENASLYTQLSRRAQELEELVQLYEEANLRASTDALTNLRNRRFFLDQLNRDFAQARRHQRYLSILMIDIDHFKSFNDTYGHAMGDQVLMSVAAVLGQAVRMADIVARYGGEEFIVALPDTDLEGAMVVAERIRRAVSEIELLDPEGKPLRQLTVSLGATTLSGRDERIADLIERADRALYLAKLKGRDQLQVIEV